MATSPFTVRKACETLRKINSHKSRKYVHGKLPSTWLSQVSGITKSFHSFSAYLLQIPGSPPCLVGCHFAFTKPGHRCKSKTDSSSLTIGSNTRWQILSDSTWFDNNSKTRCLGYKIWPLADTNTSNYSRTGPVEFKRNTGLLQSK